MENWIGAIVILAIVVGIILFFAPLIIIYQLGNITNLLRQIGEHMDVNHDELMSAKNGEEPNTDNANDRQKELIKSLFNKKNTSD